MTLGKLPPAGRKQGAKCALSAASWRWWRTKRAPAGSKVEVSDTAAHLKALTAAQITALPGIGVSGLISNNANVSYNVAQTTAIIASGITVAAAGADTVTENFASGAYSVFENGSLITQKSVNGDGSYDIAHFDVSGLGYSSYEDLYNSSGAHVAEAHDMLGGSGDRFALRQRVDSQFRT